MLRAFWSCTYHATTSSQQFAADKQHSARCACRLERQVLCGRLWHAECQQLGAALPNELPLAFASQAEYVAAFEPLLFEEARESTRSEWNQNCERGWSHVVDIGRCGAWQAACSKLWQASHPRVMQCHLLDIELLWLIPMLSLALPFVRCLSLQRTPAWSLSMPASSTVAPAS